MSTRLQHLQNSCRLVRLILVFQLTLSQRAYTGSVNFQQSVYCEVCFGRLLGYYPILISSQHLKTVWRRLLTAVRCEWWNGATGFAIPFSVFDPLPTSAFGKPRSTTDDAAVAIATISSSSSFFHFFFLPIFFPSHFFLIKKISPCLSPYAWSEGTPIIISAWYRSDIFPVSALWPGERQWCRAVFIPLKINAFFLQKVNTDINSLH